MQQCCLRYNKQAGLPCLYNFAELLELKCILAHGAILIDFTFPEPC